MKKQIALILAGALTVCMASCNGNQTYETTIHTTEAEKDAIILQTTEGTTETMIQETTSSMITPVVSSKEENYPITTAFSDLQTRLLFTAGGIVYYYDQVTEEIKPFCFDPLCKHDDYDCISYKFEMTNSGLQMIRYCEYDNRFYALRGEQFCSFSFDGSDLTVVHSFGVDGNFETEMKGYLYGGLMYLQIHGKNIYFIARDNESGKRGLMCYDAETKEMKRLFYDENSAVYGYLLSESGVYIYLVGAYQGLYYMPYEGGTVELIAEDVYDSFADGIFDGKYFYFIETTPHYDEEKKYTSYIPDKVVAFNPETKNLEDIMEINIPNEHRLLAVTNDYIYYTVNEPISIGYSEGLGMTAEVFNDYSKIYRYDKESGEVAIVLDDLRCETKMLYFIGDKVLILGNVCTPSEDEAFRTSGGFIASLDENGTFMELKQLAEK